MASIARDWFQTDFSDKVAMPDALVLCGGKVDAERFPNMDVVSWEDFCMREFFSIIAYSPKVDRGFVSL